MDVHITKGSDRDWIRIIHDNGQIMETTFPKKGAIPHDAVHYFVEHALQFQNGFWAMVAAGEHPEAIAEIAKKAGHASASRASIPAPHIVQLLQAERLVECFEANLWSAGSTPSDFRAMADTACASSFTPSVPLSDEMIENIQSQIAAFAQEWMAAPLGYQFCFNWP